MSNQAKQSRTIQLGSDKLLKFFTENLNRIYCAKKHIVARFPEIAELAYFSDIRHAIEETVDDVKKQIRRMDEIYELLGSQNSMSGCTGLAGMIEEIFTVIADQKDDVALRDMAILFYLQNTESIEVTSFQSLQIIARQIKNDEIIQLLQENLDEAREDRKLLQIITEKY